MRLAYIAEIVGKAGVSCVKEALLPFRKEQNIDFVIAGADAVTNASGLGRIHAGYLRKLGVDLLCLGDSAYYKKDLVEQMDRIPYVLRPANIGPPLSQAEPFSPGVGMRIFSVGKEKLAVLVLLGQVGITRMHADNPFYCAQDLIARVRRETPHIFVDFHAQASAEKRALFNYLDGHCSALVGSHTRVQTDDAYCSPLGTAFITDAGRTGSLDSVGGTEALARIAEYRSAIPDWTRPAWKNPVFQGVLIELDAEGRARSIEPFSLPCKELPGEEHRTDSENRIS